jgi:hypothetical protein
MPALIELKKKFKSFRLTASHVEVVVKSEWTDAQKVIFRIAFIFFALFSIPLDVGFYKLLWYIDYAHLNYRHLTEIFVFYNPQFLNHFSEGGFFGWQSYANILLILVVAIAGGLIWTYLDRSRGEYNVLYYWVRVLARYRVGYAGIAWGYKKLFIMQMPEQYEGLWNTPLIDFFAKRLYWEHISISPSYEFFLGFAEFIGGFLLLFRRTTTIGAFITLAVFGNIAIANHAYDIGEQVPSACMAMLSIFILWRDLPAIWSLVVKERDAAVTRFYPVLSKWQNLLRLTVKYSFNFVFVVLFCILEIYAFTHNDFYKIPNTPGLTNARGYYNVTEFRLNNQLIPYSPFDKKRWQDVTFEKWSSLSFKVADRPQEIEMFAAGSYPKRGEVYDNKWKFNWQGDIRRYRNTKEKYEPEKRDINISWEASGMSGRVWYTYKADTVNQVLYLQNKNKADRGQKQVLQYIRPTEDRIILNGTNEFNDSIYVVLDRVQKEYPLHARRNASLIY